MARIRDTWKTRTGTKAKRYGLGKRWHVIWTDLAGDEKYRAFTRKTEAQQWANTVETDMLRGAYVDPFHGKITLAEYVEDRWKPTQHHLNDNTLVTYDRHWRNRIKPRLGRRPLGSLTRSDMKSFVAEVRGTVGTSTLHTTFATLRIFMQAAVDDELIVANPCTRVKLPPLEDREVVIFSAEQVQTLADAMSPRYRLAVILAVGAGLRQGEALGVTEKRVEFLRRRLVVRKQMQNGDLVDVKTKAGRRIVPLDDGVRAAIAEHMRQFPPNSDGVLITNTKSAPLTRSRFGEVWRNAVRKAGMPTGTRFHDLRHFYASAQIAAGVNSKAIQARMGHASITETFDTYGHLLPDHEDLGRGAMDAALSLAS